VRRAVTVKWWERWKMRERVLAARRAYDRSQVSKNWVEDLTPEELDLIAWLEMDAES
jgi:hypothetical protein